MTTRDDADKAPLSVVDRERAERIGFSIKRIIESGAFKPPLLPEVAALLMTVAREPEVRIADIEAIVCRDPAVAARVLRAANSPFYRGSQVFTSISAAITRIGLRDVRDIAFQVATMSTVFRVPRYAERMRELSSNAMISGAVAREICKTLRVDVELAYLCGLLHDMGEAAILGIVADGCTKKRQPVPPLSELATTVEGYHELVGAWITRHWKLADVITDAILDHHHPDRSRDTMPAVLATTDRIVAHAALPRAVRPAELERAAIFDRLGLSAPQIASIAEFAERAIGESAKMR